MTVTRQDLTSAQQAVQSTHAAIDFIFKHPNKASPWHKQSNYLVCLAVKTEQDLINLIKRSQLQGVDYTVFREPDIGNVITAICLEPCDATRKLTSNIPLMFKNLQQ